MIDKSSIASFVTTAEIMLFPKESFTSLLIAPFITSTTFPFNTFPAVVFTASFLIIIEEALMIAVTLSFNLAPKE